MKAGDIVMIYSNPVTQERPGGKAKLIKQYRPDAGDGLSMWYVEFVDEPGEEYLRTVTAAEASP